MKIKFLGKKTSSSSSSSYSNLIIMASSLEHASIPESWRKILKERSQALLEKKPGDFLSVDLDSRRKVIFITKKSSLFENLGQIAKAFQACLSGVCQVGGDLDQELVEAFVWGASAAQWQRPHFQSEPPPAGRKFDLVLECQEWDTRKAQTLARACNLVRELAILPANTLNPETYRKRIEQEARDIKNVQHTTWTYPKLLKMKAGAFCAVAQGSRRRDQTGIVHLSHASPKKTSKRLVLVGKGITYDTGGVSLKPPKYMFGMHNDMSGSAVALALFKSLVELKYPLDIDCYMAITDNAISQDAYTPNEVVYAMNGKSIETVHTDAEGRMVLADTLCLASKSIDTKKHSQNLILDFATLTGLAVAAIGTAYSCVFSSRPGLHPDLIAAGEQSGERVWPFPSSEDFMKPLQSDIADIKQCRLEGGPDHIEAFMFLKSFVTGPWDYVHVDLSASEHDTGLGAVPTKTTGFGVHFGEAFVRRYFGLDHLGS